MAKLEIKKITECSYEKSFGFRIRGKYNFYTLLRY